MKPILSIILFACITTIYAQTTITGGIFSDQTWTKANSPYTITGNTTVFPNVVLTIEPGVVVKFKPSIQFRVRGTLNINGVEGDSILFTAADIKSPDPKDSWEGVLIELGQGGTVNAQYLIYEYSFRGFSLFTGNSTNLVYNFTHCTFRNNLSAIASNGDAGDFSASITYCSFFNNNSAVHSIPNTTIDHCLFKGGLYGVASSYQTILTNSEFSDLDFGIGLQNNATVDNCYIHHCSTGALLWPGLTIINSRLEYNGTALLASYPYDYTSNSIHDNIICGNTYGIKGYTAYPLSIKNNCWCLNSQDVPTAIYDAYDDATLGIISFEPIITGCTITPPRVVTPVTTSILSSSTNTKTLQVFPNPTTQTLYFDQAINSGTITIYTSDSKIVTQQKMTTSQINVSELPAGYYIVSIQTENENYHSTFIKQ